METELNNFFPSAPSVSSNRILYTPSSFARTSLLYLQEVGSLKALSPHKSSRSDLASYLCFCVLSGKGQLNYGGQLYYLEQGDCVFVDCRKEYSHITGLCIKKNNFDNLWSLQWVHFNGVSLSAIYNKYTERGGQPVFHPADFQSIILLISEIYSLAESPDYIRDMRINEKLNQLLTHLMEESWNPESISDTPKHVELRRIKEYLDDNYANRILLNDLSERFFINKYYLTRIFKEQYGSTVNNYVLSKRITRSKQLLRFSGKSIDEIAFESGFGDSHYFCRMFKKVEGITPGDFRKMW